MSVSRVQRVEMQLLKRLQTVKRKLAPLAYAKAKENYFLLYWKTCLISASLFQSPALVQPGGFSWHMTCLIIQGSSSIKILSLLKCFRSRTSIFRYLVKTGFDFIFLNLTYIYLAREWNYYSPKVKSKQRRACSSALWHYWQYQTSSERLECWTTLLF